MGVPGVPRTQAGRGEQRRCLPERGARQGRGEATATLRNDGSVGLFYLVPGSLGTDTAPTWEPREFPGPNGEKNTVIFLNEPARQGLGEATATLRNDGSAGLLYLAPGSLGSGTTKPGNPGSSLAPSRPSTS